MLFFLQPPRPAEVDHPQSLRNRLGHKRPRSFMRRRQKKQLPRPDVSARAMPASAADNLRCPITPEKSPPNLAGPPLLLSRRSNTGFSSRGCRSRMRVNSIPE